MENIGQPKDTPKRRWDVVEQRGIDMDRSLPCILCRCSAIGAGGGCCADCMITVMLETQRFKLLININKL
jgi:hypothetical protein